MPPEPANDTIVHIVSYLEVAPSGVTPALKVLAQIADWAHAATGYQEFEVLRRIEPAHHFAIVETWRDAAAWQAHGMAVESRDLKNALGAHVVGPIDQRSHHALAVAPARLIDDAAIFVVTHVDVVPPQKDAGVPMVAAFAASARAAAGNLRFDALQQADRANHMTLVEVWADLGALEAYGVATPTREFRDQLVAMSGSPYDARAYRRATLA